MKSKWVNAISDCTKCCKEGKGECSKYCGSGSKYFNKQGYFINVKRTSPRKGKHERLLRALIRSVNIYSDGMVTWKPNQLTPREADELISIKQAMEKKGGAK
jgi:hypothetical protein